MREGVCFVAKIDSGISQIAVPAPVAADRTLNGITSIHRIQQRAPAWFYSGSTGSGNRITMPMAPHNRSTPI
jgi:hypothetical protein